MTPIKRNHCKARLLVYGIFDVGAIFRITSKAVFRRKYHHDFDTQFFERIYKMGISNF